MFAAKQRLLIVLITFAMAAISPNCTNLSSTTVEKPMRDQGIYALMTPLTSTTTVGPCEFTKQFLIRSDDLSSTLAGKYCT